MKIKEWDGKDLKGFWWATLKIDGVRALRDVGGKWVSKRGKPLYNLDHLPDHYKDIEVFLGDWSSSVSACRTHDGVPVPIDKAYQLNPLEDRLRLRLLENPDGKQIRELLVSAVNGGYEGIVLHSADGSCWIKVKPSVTYDVKIVGLLPGKGKHLGRLGAFVTEYGNVGTGLTDAQREEYNDPKMIGETIEVECMSLTPDGKFRHPRFVRHRWDK